MQGTPTRYVLLAAVLLLSGCSGNAPAKVAPTTTYATEATVTADTGGIEGQVLDDEVQPIGGAEVGILRSTIPSVKTDQTGRFAFSELPAGKHDIVVQALGFHDAAISAEVQPGEVTKVNVTLKPKPIEIPVNTLSPSQNTLWLHDHYGPPNSYWINTIKGKDKEHDPAQNTDCAGYNSLGFIAGAQKSEWTVPLDPELPADARLDPSQKTYVRLYLCPFNGDETTGSVSVSWTLSNGEKTLAVGEAKPVNLAGPTPIKVEWEAQTQEDRIVATGAVVWDILVDGYYVAGLGLGGCQSCEHQSSITFPVV